MSFEPANKHVQSEEEMRESQAPTPCTSDELAQYVESLVDRDHDYGTCVYAMSLAATAAFNFVARQLGVTGFQASCADLDILRRTRSLDGPFIVIKAEDDVYPQYDNLKKVIEAQQQWRSWVVERAKKKLSEAPDAHPAVLAHWRGLAAETAES